VHAARVALLVLATTTFALHASTRGWRHFERVGTESGPTPGVITALYQDRTGFIWIGSRESLTLYDGHTFVVFEHNASDPTSISDNAIRAIYEDREGNLWIGTNTGGLNRLDRAKWEFEHFRHDSKDPSSISHDSVYTIFQDSDGTLWVGTQRGLNRFDSETGTFERMLANPAVPGSISHDYVTSIYEDSAGSLWVGTLGGGLNRWNSATGGFTVLRHDANDARTLNDDQVWTIVEDPSGGLWIGTISGLNLMDRRDLSFQRFEGNPDDGSGLSDSLVTSIALGHPGTLWVGTHGGGLNELDIASRTFKAWRYEPNRRNSLSNDVVISLLADNGGTLWVGTWGGGLNRLTSPSSLFAALADETPTPDEIGEDDITSIGYDSRGGIWIGTRSGYVVRHDRHSGTYRRYLRGGDEGIAQIILQIREGPTGRIWIGTNGGILTFDPASGEIEEYSHDPGDPTSLGSGYVKGVLFDREGRLWVGTGEGGLHRLDGDGRVIERFVHDPGNPASLSDDYITALVEDSHGKLWVGTRSGGLNALDRSSGQVVRYLPDPGDEDALSYHYITAIVEDSRGRLWVGTGGGGLNRAENRVGGGQRFTRFTESDGLIDDDVMGIVEDDDGSLWLSTKRGLSRFDPVSESFTSFYISDGLPAAEFEPGAFARVDDVLYFGSVGGVVAIPAGTPFPPPSPSPTVLRSIRTSAGEIRGERPAWDLDHLEVSYGDWLALELSVLDYGAERRHRYAYSIGGDWIELGSRRDITFTDLEPGTHEFSARGRNSQGVWSRATPALRIRVVPPFWMTGWFRGAAALFVIALALVTHQFRLNAVEKRNRELLALHEQREKARQELGRAYERLRWLTRRLEVAKEEERRHIARELHDEMGPTLTAVIINLELLSKGRDPAETSGRYADTIELVDRMIQRVRDLSLDLSPPLLDELGLVPALRGYMEAQTERTGIDIDVGGDTDLERLPPEIEITAFRVVQEAVTNVIRHAKTQYASVTVRHRKRELELIIEDEGVGFDVGETMERAAFGKALGLLGMQERVRSLGGEAEIVSSPGAGTRVRVLLPVEVES